MLKIHEIFKSIQGQGNAVGFPTLFIRLYGCNRTCSYCDTPQDTYKEMSIKKIMKKVKKAKKIGITRICITGGEPTYQNGLTELLEELEKEKDYISVYLFTNGYNFNLLSGGFENLTIRWDVKDFDELRELSFIEDIECASFNFAFTVNSKDDYYRIREILTKDYGYFSGHGIEVTATEESGLSKWLAKRVVELSCPDLFMGSRLHKYLGVR